MFPTNKPTPPDQALRKRIDWATGRIVFSDLSSGFLVEKGFSMRAPSISFSIRQATLADLDTICELEKSAFPPGRQATRETLEKRMKLFNKGFFVLVTDGNIAGFSTALLLVNAELSTMDRSDSEVYVPNGKIYYLRSLAVGKEFQSRGYGKLLIDEQMRNAKTLGAERMVFTCVPEVADYYRRLGFTKLTDFVHFHGHKEALWEVPSAFFRN